MKLACGWCGPSARSVRGRWCDWVCQAKETGCRPGVGQPMRSQEQPVAGRVRGGGEGQPGGGGGQQQVLAAARSRSIPCRVSRAVASRSAAGAATGRTCSCVPSIPSPRAVVCGSHARHHPAPRVAGCARSGVNEEDDQYRQFRSSATGCRRRGPAGRCAQPRGAQTAQGVVDEGVGVLVGDRAGAHAASAVRRGSDTSLQRRCAGRRPSAHLPASWAARSRVDVELEPGLEQLGRRTAGRAPRRSTPAAARRAVGRLEGRGR